MADVIIILALYILILLMPVLFGVPLPYAIGISSLAIMVLPFGPDFILDMFAIKMYRSTTNFILIAIPFYIFAGELLNRNGAVDAIFEFANLFVGRIRGGMAQVNIFASLIFSGMSGSAVADAAGLGKVEFRMMDRAGYEKGFITAVIGSSAIIGPIIPPSIPLIMYGVLAEVSIGDLFLGGVIPGIIMSIMLVGAVVLLLTLNREKYVTEPPDVNMERTMFETAKVLVNSIPALFTIVLIVGGIATGAFTATEAGAIAVIWAILIGVFYYRELGLDDIWDASYRSLIDVGSLMIILSSAAIYAFVVTRAGIPRVVSDVITNAGLGPTGTLLAIALILILMGTILDPLTNLILIIPIIAPNFMVLGIDPLHAGIVIVLALMLGLLTPPVGIILFVLEQITEVPMETIFKSIIPFYVPLFISLLLIILFPSTVTYIPNHI